jgi:tRNA threonylcarbamoyladenosine biosynthesis protein TsaE
LKILAEEPLRILTDSTDETRAVGERLGRLARGGLLITLEGDLGAGKTVLVQGLARGLEVSSPIMSPTFLYLRRHEGRLTLLHADLYRIGGPEDLEGIGLWDLMGPSVVTVVEWADRASDGLPKERITLRLDHQNTQQRLITITAVGDDCQRLLKRLKSGLGKRPA